jgi:propionate CoA-transferase
MNSSRIMTAEQAVALIQDGDTLTVCGCGSIMVPEKTLIALEQRFIDSGHPRDLVVANPIVVGKEQGTGLEHFAAPGMVKKLVGSTYSLWEKPRLSERIVDGEVEAYVYPMGVLFQWLWAIGAGQPGVLTKVGLNTFVDPRLDGGRCNDMSRDPLVEQVTLGGEEYLYYKCFPIDVAIIRGTTADEDGNISMEHEPLFLDMLPMALAARASGGKVIAQVKRVTRRGSLHPKSVQVPGFLVDAVVVDKAQRQSELEDSPSLTGEVRALLDEIPPLALDAEKVIARRGAQEMQPGDVVNLGFGVPAVMPQVALEEGIFDQVVLTTEHGAIGGVPESRKIFGVHHNPDALIRSLGMFAMYDGGGLDITYLGFAQLDRAGNVNVSKFGRTLPGCGGFIDITHNVKRIVFCATFTSGGLKTRVRDGRIEILQEGRHKKLVPQVEQVTFSAKNGHEKGQTVFYVTERAVFRLGPAGVELVEIAPGIDLERDILPHVGFELMVSPDLKEMDARLFQAAPLALAQAWSRSA